MTTDPHQDELNSAIEAHRRGDRPRAREALASIVARSPEHHQAVFLLGCVTAEMGDIPSGEAALRRALELAPDQPEYLARLSRMLLRQRRPIEAAEAIQRIIETSAPMPAHFIDLGNIRLIARQFEPAAAAFRRAIELDPSNIMAGSGLILALSGLERHDDAVAEARRFTERCPASAEAFARLSMILERLNRVEEARPAADRAVALDPNHGLSQFTLGTIQFRQSQHEPARASLERALALATDPLDKQEIARTLGRTLDALGLHDLAFARFRESKPPAASISPAVRQMSDEFLRFIEASRRDITPWAVAAWAQQSPPYVAFSTPPIFVVGFPRSGTTLLERMLGAHGGFITTDEYPAMSKLREHLQRHAGGIENVPVYLGQIGEPEIRLLRAIYFGEVERILAGQDPIGKRLVDRHPINIAHLSIVRRIFPDAPVIVCLRDPRDAVFSAYTRLARNPTATAFFASLESSADYYAATMSLWLHFREVLGLSSLELKYEDLVTNPEPVCRRLLEFLKMDWNPDMLRFSERAGGAAIRSASYQQVNQELTTGAVGRWRHYRKHFGAALQTLAPFVQAFGYDAE